MELVTRKKGSQRQAAPIELTFEPNFTGSGGSPVLTFLGSDGRYYMISFQKLEEVRELLSQAHIVHHNWGDEQTMEEIRKRIFSRG